MDMSAFYKEHADLATIVTRLRGLMTTTQPSNIDSAAAIASDLMQLSSKLTIHLGKEDLYLYPKLMKAPGPAKTLAEAFQKEMGGLNQGYTAFKLRWATAQQIAAKPEEFMSEANTILDALEVRIKRENTELYKAAEKV